MEVVPLCDMELKYGTDNRIYSVNYKNEHISCFFKVTSYIPLGVTIHTSLIKYLSLLPAWGNAWESV
jgi:hypothetical protein